MAAVDGLDADLFGQGLERGVLEQVVDGFGNRAISILQFLFGTVAGGGVGGVGDLAVGAETLVFVRDVVGRDADIEAQIERGMNLGNDLFALQLAHSFVEETDVGVESDRIDVAVLLAAE